MTEIIITDGVVIYNDMERGWVRGKTQPLWHRKAYDMWKHIWTRVYFGLYWFGRTIQPKYKYLSGFIEDLQRLDNFEAFKDNPTGWCIDKDLKGGTYIGYYFEYLSLISRSTNAREVLVTRNKRYCFPKGDKNPLKNKKVMDKIKTSLSIPIIGINIKDNTILILKSTSSAYDLGFTSTGNITSCLKGRIPSYKGYKWIYLDMNDRV